MPKYKQSSITAKSGINFVRSTVEHAGSLFHKIEQESDLGVDGLIELIKDEQPLNKQIAVQIKAGESYFDAKTEECKFPIGSHRDYWSKHPLPVIGIVYLPSTRTAHWINIKRYLEKNPSETSVRFHTSEANRFDETSFSRLFVPAVAGGIPVLEFDEALNLSRSDKPDEQYLGLLVLFRRYAERREVWDELVRFFVETPSEEIPGELIYWLAHIPGHGDIFYYGKTPSNDIREYAHGLMSTFGEGEIAKMLSLIDPETSIGRGTLGQSVEAIVSSLPNRDESLKRILRDPHVDISIRESAAIILAFNIGRKAIEELSPLAQAGSLVAQEIVSQLAEWGGINPY